MKRPFQRQKGLFAQERNAQKTLFLAWSQAKGKMNRSAMDGRVSRFLPKGALVTGPDVLHRSFAYFLQDTEAKLILAIRSSCLAVGFMVCEYWVFRRRKLGIQGGKGKGVKRES